MFAGLSDYEYSYYDYSGPSLVRSFFTGKCLGVELWVNVSLMF